MVPSSTSAASTASPRSPPAGGVSRETVWHKIRNGEMRARKIGNGWAVHGTAIRDYETGTDFGVEAGT